MTKKPGSYKLHQNLIKRFKLLACKEIPSIRFFDQHVGMFYRKNGAPIRIGTKGMADVFGLLKTDNGLMFLSFEFKTGEARLSKDQLIWKKFIEDMNGIYIVVRDAKESVDDLKTKLDKLGIVWG